MPETVAYPSRVLAAQQDWKRWSPATRRDGEAGLAEGPEAERRDRNLAAIDETLEWIHAYDATVVG